MARLSRGLPSFLRFPGFQWCLTPLITALIVVFGLAFLVSPVAAKRLYKYQDEDGIWHYSDRAPDTDLPVESKPIPVNNKARLRVRSVTDKTPAEIWFFNETYGPMQIQATLHKSMNVTTTPSLPHSFVHPGHGERKLITVAPRDKRKNWSYELHQTAVPGDPSARHDRRVLYLPPFPVGTGFLISQAFGGEFSHTERHARYAVDITMPEGTPVRAARDGIVMDVEQDFYGSGLNVSQYAHRANNVRVLHEDGTMAIYAHLRFEGVRVHPGSVVLAGDIIAESGATGYASGPHLHFAVQRNAGMKLESVPIKFRGPDGKAVVPMTGNWLYASE